MTAPAVFPQPSGARLEATVVVLHDIAEAHLDTQAARQDTEQRAWLRGYRSACQDVLNAAQLYREVPARDRA